MLEKGAHMGDSFALGLVIGCVIGAILAWVIGAFVRKILWCWGRVKAIGKPQDIKSTADKAPWQVLVDGCKSLCILIILIIIFLACLVGIFLSLVASG
jgi:uncharacterized membrane protein SpoIIM required for sporulation